MNKLGMFDIIENLTIYCPQCGKVIEDELQTKSFEHPGLHHYKIGDKLSSDDRNYDDHIEVHGICDNCNLLTRVWLRVVDDILTAEFY